MERISVASLTDGGMGKVIGGNETWGEETEQRKEKSNREWAQDRNRVRKAEAMLDMGQSQLHMSPQILQSYSSQSDRSRGSSTSDDSYVITDSALLMKAKTRLDPKEKKAVARLLAEALDADNFFRVWPGHEDWSSKDKAEGKLSPELMDAGDWRRKLVKETWDRKEERTIERRGRVEGGYEDTMEAEALRSTDMFRPMLMDVMFDDDDDHDYTEAKKQNVRDTMGRFERERAPKPTTHRAGSWTDQRHAERGSNKERERSTKERTLTNSKTSIDSRSDDSQPEQEQKSKSHGDNQYGGSSDEEYSNRFRISRLPSFRNLSDSSEEALPVRAQKSKILN
ncbi:unnamed protein product [Diplocarpon coronariae]|nr:hypothetical protein JHW43_001365 [Diplocarpon mali]